MHLEVEKRLNPYLANLAVMFIKLHDIHWNVKGQMFIQVHEHTESLYDEMAEKLDEVAEKIIMKGGKPISKIKGYLEAATIEELEDFDYHVENVLEVLLKDFEQLKQQAIEIRSYFDEEGEFTITMLLEDHISAYEKEIWFLKSMTA